MEGLSKPRVARLWQMEFGLCEMECEFSITLDATTRAIRDAELEIAQPKAFPMAIEAQMGGIVDLSALSIAARSALLASLVREVANEKGWLAGWKCLAQASPDSGIHNALLEDGTCRIQTSDYKNYEVFSRL
jgi:hypothetical protein